MLQSIGRLNWIELIWVLEYKCLPCPTPFHHRSTANTFPFFHPQFSLQPIYVTRYHRTRRQYRPIVQSQENSVWFPNENELMSKISNRAIDVKVFMCVCKMFDCAMKIEMSFQIRPLYDCWFNVGLNVIEQMKFARERTLLLKRKISTEFIFSGVLFIHSIQAHFIVSAAASVKIITVLFIWCHLSEILEN